MYESKHFLEIHPLDWTRKEVQELHRLVAKMYFREDEVIRLIRHVGIPVEEIRWGTSMYAAWHEIMVKAHDRGMLETIFKVIREDSSKSEYHSRIGELLSRSPIIATPNKDNIDWINKEEPFESQLERIIGEKSNLLDISFLNEGVRVGKAVTRLLVTFSDGQYYGTGFLISRDMVLTNHHVLFNHSLQDECATKVELWFDYERAFRGGLKQRYECFGEISSIKGQKEFDWAIIKLPSPMPEDYPYLKLGGKMPSKEDRVYIIQHPGGAIKQVGLHNNVVRYVDDKIIQYWTDTEGGSSGSPVFNSDWEVVALHQSWQSVNHQSNVEYRNQGVNINQVINGLKSKQSN